MDEPEEVEIDDHLDGDQSGGGVKPAKNRLWMYTVLGAAFLLTGLAITIGRTTQPVISVHTENPETQSAYHLILSEMRTGVRLVKLDEFISEHADSNYIPTARAQRAALKEQEELAWSELTDQLFDVEIEPEAKQKAIAKYTDAWGTLVRAGNLEELNKESTDEDEPGFKPITKKSRFAGKGDAGDLVGAPIVRQPVRPPTRPIAPRTRPGSPVIVDAKVRSKKSPTYPRSAKRRKIPGYVTLALDIDRRGRVVDTRVISVEARRYERDFVKAATRAAKRTRFHPKTINGRAVPTRGFVQRYAFKVSR